MRQVAAALLVTSAGHERESRASRTPAPPDETPAPPTPPKGKAKSRSRAWKPTHARSV
jgi:hypothetical protein